VPSETYSKAARLAALALLNLRGGLKEAKELSTFFDVDPRTIYRDYRDAEKVVEALVELQGRYGLSPVVDNRNYSASEAGKELGISPRAITNLAKRRGIAGNGPPGKRDRWTFTRADIEALRVRGAGGRPKKNQTDAP